MSAKTVLLCGAAAVWLTLPAFADGGPVPEPLPPAPPAEEMPVEEPAPVEEAAPAPEDLWYLEGFLGVTYADELQWGCCFDEMELGYHGGAAIGRHVTPNFDLEAEFFYGIMGYEGLETSISGLNFMINAYYRLNMGVVDPYIGAGVGVTRVSYDGADLQPLVTGHDHVLGYQGIAGLMFHLPEVDLFLEYRYQDTAQDAEINGVDIEYHSHNGSAGFRINF